MNSLLGARIKELRESKGITQEQIAAEMNCTRQKVARLEKGLLDISYFSITKIAQILRVKIEDITSAVNGQGQMGIAYRSSNPVKADEFEYIHDMLETFYTHKNLYDKSRKVDECE